MLFTSKAVVLIVLSAGAGVITGCASRPSALPATGEVAGLRWQTTVDHPLARAYLGGESLPEDLRALRARLGRTETLPSRAELAGVADRYSPDVAALLFAEAVMADPRNRAFRARYRRALACLEAGRAPPSIEDPRLLVAFAPGWLYEHSGAATGADFARPRAWLEALGVDTHLIPTDENGPVADNAERIASALRALAARQRRVIIASASKSGAEVALALGRELEPEATRHVLAWVSIGGTVRGTPFADRVLAPDLWLPARLYLGWQGFDLEGVRSLRADVLGPAFEALQLPEHVFSVAYLAAPLSGDISEGASFGYRLLRRHGPNDGLMLLADGVLPGGVTLLEPGADHYFAHPDARRRTLALFLAVAEAVEVLAGWACAQGDARSAGEKSRDGGEDGFGASRRRARPEHLLRSALGERAWAPGRQAHEVEPGGRIVQRRDSTSILAGTDSC